MKRKILALTLILLFSLPALAQNWAGKFTELEGKVWVQRNEGKISAQLGMEVLPGDVVITEADSRARIWFRDHSVITISENSKFKVDALEYAPGVQRRSIFQLLTGRIKSWVSGWFSGAEEPDYQVQALSTVAGVRGTEFITEIVGGEQGREARFYCLSGSLTVWSPGVSARRILLNEGQFLRAGEGGVLFTPERITREQRGQLEKNFKFKKGGSRNERAEKVLGLRGIRPLIPTGARPPLISPLLSGEEDHNDPSKLIFQEPPGFTPVIIRVKPEETGASTQPQ